MNLKISGHHLELTPSLREFVVNKLERVLRHFDQLIGAEVILSVDKTKEKAGRQIASVTVYLKGKEIFVEKCDENMYAAIDKLIDMLDRKVMQYKDKVQDHGREALKHQQPPEAEPPQ
ncbi:MULTISPECIES: ribosome hibernation-promoting factor, HPF/YfiA family [Pandoraea]|uniref:Ribosome hibernation promoting factor n=1 Tax=Pandoraea communis TaxID=2508297 RepID=A0A5E4RQW7_9BURK|nr:MULTISPECIES: ribosome-associated translation inhibitor RaiA [Pandoraea]EON14503.1 sigma 54 modulation protein/ribosomal protein S30EA [Pandoraea sp. SD6-2]MDM8355476.1 ribosome-associated translation inhibitor RaiA [Pandoraea communis]VVD64258.1 ribosomal subunit interface protein [Pandoraea communis]VVD68003.1 ribosomal subunit interface protein [Pandoraea communis]